MGKYGKGAGICLAAAAPALVSGSVSPPLSLACALNLLVAGCAAVGAVKLSKRTENPLLAQFAALMVSAAVAFGGELIICAAFPSSFEGAPTFALTGAPLFFAACTAPRFSESRHALCCTAAAALAVILLGIIRLVFTFLPLSGDVSMGLIFAGIIAAVIGVFIPQKEVGSWEA